MKKQQVTTKLSVSYAFITILMILVIGILFYANSKHYIYEKGIENASQLVESAIKQVDACIDNMDQTTIDVLGSNRFQQVWERFGADASDDKREEISRILCDAYKNKNDVRRVAVFDRDGNYVCTGRYAVTVQEVRERYTYVNSLSDNSRLSVKNYLKPSVDFWDPDSNSRVVSEVKPIVSKDNRITGYIEVQQNILYINKICDLTFNGQQLDTMIWFGDNDELFYSNIAGSHAQKRVEDYREATRQSTKLRVTDDQYIFTQSSNQYIGRLVCVVSKKLLFEQLYSIGKIILLVGVCLILFTLAYTSAVTKIIMKPIHSFVTYVSHVDLMENNSGPPMEIKDRETEILMTSLNGMKTRLQEAIKEQQKMEEVQTKTLFGILQTEMSPHFLYNTLGSIANMCERDENEAASDACYSLTEILRYSSNYSDNEVSIKEEISNLKSYLSIMKSRYRQRLQYEIQIDENVEHLILPKLTYQPLVENAIKYSLLEQEQVIIKIYTVLFKDLLIIEIKDNGCGISREDDRKIKEKVECFKQDMNNAKTSGKVQPGGLGLVGTLVRLTIFFGDDFSYKLLNNNDEGGTTVVLNINMERNK